MAVAPTDQDDWETFTCGGHQYTLPKRYENPSVIGHGAFGAVIRAFDQKTGKDVAIKKMLHPFQTPSHAKRTYRELKLLQHLTHRDAQVIQLLNVFSAEANPSEFQTVYFVFNFADYDLNRVIRRQVPFTEEHIRQIIYSLLRGLKFIHSGGIIHRDLKPSNIGITKNSDVTILDFGLARILADEGHTTYVATRWWRAPEVYINQKHYREKLDIWSVGCIMAELILLRPIFRGTDHIDQLNEIFKVLGTPKPQGLNEICTKDACDYITGLPPKAKQDYNELFGFKYHPGSKIPISGVSPEGIAFLDRLLSFDHRIRPTAEEALADPFLDSLHDPMDEPTTEPVVDEHDSGNYTIPTWKSIIWQTIQSFEEPTWVDEDTDDEE